MYAHSRLTNSAPSIVAGRGIQQDVRSVGYAVMQYADFYNPWPGYRGWRVTDTQGNMASLGMLNAARWSYIYQVSTGANGTQLRVFAAVTLTCVCRAWHRTCTC